MKKSLYFCFIYIGVLFSQSPGGSSPLSSGYVSTGALLDYTKTISESYAQTSLKIYPNISYFLLPRLSIDVLAEYGYNQLDNNYKLRSMNGLTKNNYTYKYSVTSFGVGFTNYVYRNVYLGGAMYKTSSFLVSNKENMFNAYKVYMGGLIFIAPNICIDGRLSMYRPTSNENYGILSFNIGLKGFFRLI